MTRRVVMIVCGLLAGTMAVLAAVAAATMVIVGHEWRLGSMFVGWAFFAVALAIGSVRYGSDRVSPRVYVDGGGTTFRPDRLLEVAMACGIAGLVIFYASELSSPWNVWVRGLFVVFALALCPSLWRFVGGGTGKYLRLTPLGIEMGQGGQVKSVSWDEVCDITDRHPRARIGTPSALVVLAPPEKPLYMTTSVFSSDVTTMRGWVEFYWQNPSARVDLVNDDLSVPSRRSRATGHR